MKKILVSDLDGTIIGKSKQLSQGIKNGISKWRAEGNEFVIATGRLISSLEYYADQLDAAKYMICCSGAVIYEDKKVIYEECLDQSYVRRLWDIMKETGGYVQVYSGANLVANRRGGLAERYEAYEKTLPKGYKIPIKYSTDIGDDFPKKVHKLSFTFKSDEEANEIISAMGDLSNVSKFKSLGGLYNIITGSTNKGIAIKHLIKNLGIKDEDTYVIGDNENDISMFENFKNSAVIATAPKHILNTASMIVPSADEDGLLKFIESIAPKGI